MLHLEDHIDPPADRSESVRNGSRGRGIPAFPGTVPCLASKSNVTLQSFSPLAELGTAYSATVERQ